MSFKQFSKILFINIFIIIIINMFFYFDFVKSLFKDYKISISISLIFLAFQIIINIYLLKDYKLWLTKSLNKKNVFQGVVVIIIVQFFIISQVLFFSNSLSVRNFDIKLSFFFIFIFNSLPNAIFEEWLFRYLPYRYSKQFLSQSVSLRIGILSLLIFTIVHIPSYIFQYEINLSQLYSVLLNGIFFWFIYISTKNIFFTALCHALTNLPFNIYNSPYYSTYFYFTVTIICIIWFIKIKKTIDNSV
ncbi:CPBP family intramembrane glutamic endopeptidase [Spirosoma lituiforme]